MRVGIVGVTGYAGIELVRILSQHPEVEISLMAASCSGDLVETYPHFQELLPNTNITGDITGVEDCDVVFTATPHGQGMNIVPQLLERECKVIDLGGDFRYKSQETYEDWYKLKHKAPNLLEKACYGLPEVYGEKIKNASLIANPGCYPTASILGIYPMIKAGLVKKDSIIIDAKSGVTGAGKKLSRKVHFAEIDENMRAYGLAVHRHTSEIEEKLSLLAGDKIHISFTPHLIPVKRGILATIYLDLNESLTTEKIYEIYQDFYSLKPFVRIRKPGQLPEINQVVGSNYCDIGLKVDERLNRLIIISVIDNLVKGASGQAVQNLNLISGFDETLGLDLFPMYI
ncbi:MAG: N-acetyl-gamma-glutamyl-phosphate reductase [Halanaerobiales bacterium]|nr:N-acetyl-gamma-glutamyl-phosphate reductase [Halanaerobiales bacterium]